MSTFLHENFSRDHGVLQKFGEGTVATFDFSGPQMVFQKTAANWDHGGLQTFGKFSLQHKDNLKIRFKPLTLRVGEDNDISLTYYKFGLTVDQPAGIIYNDSYGIYVSAGYVLVRNANQTVSSHGPLTINKSYTLILDPREDSDLDVHLNGDGFSSGVLGVIPGPFLNRDVLFSFNCYSQDSVEFQDFILSGS